MPPVAIERAAGPWLRGFTTASVEPSDGFSSYGPKMNELYPPDMLVPTTALSLADGSKYDVDYLLKKVYHFVASIDSWEFTMLPVRFMKGMVTQWTEEITHFTLLQVTPEGVTPQLIEYQTAVHSLRKDHLQQGFEMKGEFFAHPAGRREFNTKREVVANNVVGSMQFAIKTAAIGSLDHWYNYQRKFGREFHNYHEAAQEMVGASGHSTTMRRPSTSCRRL